MIRVLYLGALVLTVLVAWRHTMRQQRGGESAGTDAADYPYNDELDGDLSNPAFSADACGSEDGSEDGSRTQWRLVSRAMYGAAALSPGANEHPVPANEGLRFLTQAAFKSSPCLYTTKTVCH